MKSRIIRNIKKIVSGSIYRELILAITISLIVSLSIMMIINQTFLFNNTGGIVTADELVSNSNATFVQIYKHASSYHNRNLPSYLTSLAEHYNEEIAIIDINGNVIVKSENIKEDRLDIQKIRNILQGAYNHPMDFYQVYPINWDKEEITLVVKVPYKGVVANNISNTISDEEIVLLDIIVAVIIFIALLYILVRLRIRYIKKITSIVNEISKGNLDCEIHMNGNDELAVLADNINHMTRELKNSIEQERIAERTKNELITNVSHDLKTPLTSIIGYLTLLKDGKYTDEAQMNKYINTVYRKSESLKVLIEDLFEYTKMNSEMVELSKAEVKLVEFVDQILGELSIAAKDNNIVFKKYFPDEALFILLDQAKMARVFENILMNAIKYSFKPGEVTVKIFKENGIMIVIDNKGESISQEDLGKIFDRFYRIDKSRNSKVSGSGLGLAVAKSIVNMHGGEIWAESADNFIRINIKLPIQ
ncbi:MAG: ATP-binding protein [Bacillota bacterium]|nr:ATP-binding protein [Bacillota bacterium]